MGWETQSRAERDPAAPTGRHLREQLAALLSERFRLDPPETDRLTSDVEWRVFKRGDVTFPGADEPGNRQWLILSGRLQSLRGEETGPGSFLEEGRAVRPLLVAGIPGSTLDRVAHRSPALAVARALAARAPRRAGRATVTAVVAGSGLDTRYELFRLGDGLAQLGPTAALWAERVDTLLGTPGISDSEMGDPGDFEVNRLLHRLEEDNDHLALEVGRRPTAWSRRVLESADHIAVVLRTASQPDDGVLRLLDHAPPDTERALVLVGEDLTTPTGTREALDSLSCDYALHLDTSRPGEAARMARTITGHARGLVLSGGGARGFAHLGVYRALCELGMTIDVFGGSSIGTPLAAAMADGHPPEVLEPLVARLFADVLDYTVPLVAFTGGRGIARAATEVFGSRDIEDLHLPFFGVSTDLTASDTRVHRRGSVVRTIRASCAVPGLMPPVPDEGHLLVDGGVTNNLPIDVMRRITPRGEVIAVDVVPSAGPAAREEFGLWVSGTRMLRERFRGRRPAPPISMTLMRALTVGSGSRHKEMGLAGLADRLIDIDIDRVPMLAFDRVTEIARRGYEMAVPQIEAWLEAGKEGHVASHPA
ncbi:MAG: patatin-like phospholipase family protein [Actinomycetota bacterium]